MACWQLCAAALVVVAAAAGVVGQEVGVENGQLVLDGSAGIKFRTVAGEMNMMQLLDLQSDVATLQGETKTNAAANALQDAAILDLQRTKADDARVTTALDEIAGLQLELAQNLSIVQGNSSGSIAGLHAEIGALDTRLNTLRAETQKPVDHQVVWKLIARHDTKAGYLPRNSRPMTMGTPTSDLYFDLANLEGDRSDDGYFYFKMVWPGMCSKALSSGFYCVQGSEEQTWRQTSNPITAGSTGVVGYEPLDVSYTGKFWGGIETGNGGSFIDGSVLGRSNTHPNWWYAVGAYAPHNGGIPGPGTVTEVTNIVTRVELYVTKQTKFTADLLVQSFHLRQLLSEETAGEWELVGRHDTTKGFFSVNEWSKNPTDPDNALFSILDQLEDYRSFDGRFYFRLKWPGLCQTYSGCVKNNDENIWTQQSNPVTNTVTGVATSVRGYQPINVVYGGRFFGGLEFNNQRALLDGTIYDGADWWFAFGTITPFQGKAPGPAVDDATAVAVDVTELYVMRHTPRSLALFESQNAASSSEPAQWELMFRQDIRVGVWTPNVWNLNEADADAVLFSRMNQLEAFRSFDNNFYFKLRWPELCSQYPTRCKGGQGQIWSQTSHPRFKNSGLVDNYKAISTPFTAFSGLEHRTTNPALLDGSSTGPSAQQTWWYAVGSRTKFRSSFIPGPIDAQGGLAVYVVELWVKKLGQGQTFHSL